MNLFDFLFRLTSIISMLGLNSTSACLHNPHGNLNFTELVVIATASMMLVFVGVVLAIIKFKLTKDNRPE